MKRIMKLLKLFCVFIGKNHSHQVFYLLIKCDIHYRKKGFPHFSYDMIIEKNEHELGCIPWGMPNYLPTANMQVSHYLHCFSSEYTKKFYYNVEFPWNAAQFMLIFLYDHV